MQRATIQGFLVLDHADRFEEAIGTLATLLTEGKLHYDETIVEGGLQAAPDALNGSSPAPIWASVGGGSALTEVYVSTVVGLIAL